ncbi:hypothetical protein KP509_29G002100 [Ceratopteris richardii]|uniref:Uncharacterized protein n=1 Tax=Ceratopteris richardii TaxID=49495 RepID=A0A8T2R599_CERRI|nr:hypothetical protein KP509_29G002100 [Ceratopteris richardii]
MAEDTGIPDWKELSGDAGLTSKHWRTRLSALQSLLALVDQSNVREGFLHVKLLDLLTFTLALSDTHSPVRKTAVECAGKIFCRMHDRLSISEVDQYFMGFLAISVDYDKEVQSAAAEVLSNSSILAGTQWLKEMIPRILCKFVSSALRVTMFRKAPKVPYFNGSSSPINIDVMVPALEGLVNIEQLCMSAANSKAIEEIGLQYLSLLVAALASLLEEYELSGDRVGTSKVLHLLRALGSSKYRQHIVLMISSELYEGAYLARLHRSSDLITDEILEILEKLDSLVTLKGIIVSLEDGFPPQVLKMPYEDNAEVGALCHIIKFLGIPSPLVVAINETRDKVEEEKFVKSTFFYLRVAKAVLKDVNGHMKYNDMVQDLALSCAALASADDGALSWITREVQELATDVVKCLAMTCIEFHHTSQSAKLKIDAGSSVERMILAMLPDVIPKLKNQLKDHLNTDDHNVSEVCSSSTRLASSITAAHQLCWCLKQVFHPHLSPSCTMIIPCALMALDHFSPHVKRQGLKLFNHLTDNLNPSELRWYEDPILDCITRSIVGCGELWPLLVQTAIPLAICIEGNNPRAVWYVWKILNEMLGELERHLLDATRYKVWLQNVSILFERMGLVLVVHFKRVLPLLFPWLHTQDDSMTLLVLDILKVIVTHTWPRIPFHLDRLWKELEAVYSKSVQKEKNSKVLSSVINVAQLLHMIGGPAFDSGLQEEEDSTTSLGSALADYLYRQTADVGVA